MPRIITKVGVTLAAVVAAAGLVAAAGPNTATATNEAIPAVCFDGFALWRYYQSIGDTATASALPSNLIGMGCFDDLPSLP